MAYQLALGASITPPPPAHEYVWYDTERDPLAYAQLCWREKTWRSRRKHQVFTYYRLNDWRPFMSALHQLIRSRVHIIARHFRWQTLLSHVKNSKGEIK